MTGRGMAQKSITLIEHSRRILAAIQPATVRSVKFHFLATIGKTSALTVCRRSTQIWGKRGSGER